MAKTTKTTVSNTIEIVEDLLFVPSPPQRQVKAKLVLALEDDPSVELTELTLAKALQLTGDGRLSRWWHVDGFKEWLSGKDEFRERLEYLCQLGLDTAEEILMSDDAKSVNAKVSLIKVLMEAGGKLTKVKEVKLLDEAVNKMNKLQLEEYLKRQGMLKSVNTKDEGDE